jgi:hypothetical protein
MALDKDTAAEKRLERRPWKSPRLVKIPIKEITRGGFFMGSNDFFMRMFMFMS